MKGLRVFLYVGNFCTLQNMYIYHTCDLQKALRLWNGVNGLVCRNDLHFPLHIIYMPQKHYCLLCGQGLVSKIEWCAVSFTVNYCVYHIKWGGGKRERITKGPWMPDMVSLSLSPPSPPHYHIKWGNCWLEEWNARVLLPAGQRLVFAQSSWSREHTEPPM